MSKQFPLFAGLNDEQMAELLEQSTVFTYARDEVIMMAGEEAKKMHIVLKGQVRVVDISVDGQERVMAIHNRGDCFGGYGAFGRHDRLRDGDRQ